MSEYVVASDNIDGKEQSYIQSCISALEKKGHSCENAGVGPNTIQSKGLSQNSKGKLFNTIISDKKFVQEDLKLRLMVEDVLRKEFGSRLDNHPDYEFLVDSVINKLKQQQLGIIDDDIEII